MEEILKQLIVRSRQSLKHFKSDTLYQLELALKLGRVQDAEELAQHARIIENNWIHRNFTGKELAWIKKLNLQP